MKKQTLNRREAALELNISLPTLDRLIRSGRLHAIRVSPRRIIIPQAAITAFLEGREDALNP